jgi:hypothetical protein
MVYVEAPILVLLSSMPVSDIVSNTATRPTAVPKIPIGMPKFRKVSDIGKLFFLSNISAIIRGMRITKKNPLDSSRRSRFGAEKNGKPMTNNANNLSRR